MSDSNTAMVWIIVVACVLVLLQGAWLFTNARKRNLGKMAWFWGIWGSITMPVPLFFYWLIVIRRDHRKN